jgi:hypothetical protein
MEKDPQMAHFNHTAELDIVAGSPDSAKIGLLQRVSTWFTAKVHAERDAEIAAFVAERGGQFTDEMEREISRRFGGLAG